MLNLDVLKSKCIQLWPVGLCWLLMMLADGFGARVINSQYWLLSIVVFSFFAGQFGLAVMIGGLFGRSWISGWFVAILLAITANVVVLTNHKSPRIPEILGYCCFWPQLLLVTCTPLIAMRVLRGWSFSTSKDLAIRRTSPIIEDIFLLSLVVASCFAFARVHEELVPGAGGSVNQLASIAYYSVFSLVVVTPATVVAFRAGNWGLRWIGWSLLAALDLFVIAAAYYLIAYLNGYSPNVWKDLPYLTLGVATAAITIMLGCCALLASGLRMTYFSKESSTDGDAAASITHASAATILSARWQARLVSAVVIALAAIAAIVPNFLHTERTAFFSRIQNPKEETKLIGKFQIRGNEIVGATLRPTVTDAELAFYSHEISNLERVSLSGTQVTDVGVKVLCQLNRLRDLDLSNTALTNKGLEELQCLKQLESLSVANTQVDFPKLLDIAKKLRLRELDASGIGVTDDHFQIEMSLGSILSLNLSRNPITDKGIAKLLQCRFALSKIDVSDTAIDGSCFAVGLPPAQVVLDGTQVTDANLLTLIDRPPVRGISIRRTNISPAVLPAIAKRGLGLMLGEGLISERDLSDLGKGTYEFLCLNDKKFTGACLGQGIYTSYLDLSHSGVTETTLKSLPRKYYNHINLSDTAIKDPGYAASQCFELDLRRTNVTVSSLRSLQNTRLIIGSDQFLPWQLASLPTVNIHIDEENSFPKW